ncbi:MAG: XdhC family protein [Desulforhabdus sp.]|jgi:xanthine dehydrogenase accessory factor|nr:XdhC family protein [Desulforhabdus sp.]
MTGFCVKTFKGICNLLAEGESLVTAVIVSRSGSAPRAVSTRMVVRRDGSIIGTIGGGHAFSMEGIAYMLDPQPIHYRNDLFRPVTNHDPNLQLRL